jgi:xylulokinase
MSHTIGFDVGTQSTKGLLVEMASGRVVARAARAHGLIEGLPAGAAEQHPDTWVQALEEVAHDLLAHVRREQVVAVGVSGQQHGLVALDANDRPVRAAKLWCDTSTADEAADLSRELGHLVPTGYTASKVRWMARREPANWKRVRHVLLPHDWINFVLCGERAMECGDASGTGWFDVRERRFDERAVAAIDVRLAECLPRLARADEAHTPLGRVTARAAERFGLAPGTLVSRGGGDNMMSAIGAGAVRPGVVVASLGTSGTVFAHSDVPVVDPAGLVAPFCGSAGAWLPLVCVMNATGPAEEVARAFGLAHADLTDRARAVAPGCDGLLWLPYLVGERVPDLPRATGTLLGMRAGALEPGRLYRAALEGVSANLAWGASRLAAFGVRADEVRLVGGAARNPLWREILAACFEAPVLLLEESESAALGAALQAAWCVRRARHETVTLTDVVEPAIRSASRDVPDAANVAAHRELCARFRAAVHDVYSAR